jgi:hypothetical protein
MKFPILCRHLVPLALLSISVTVSAASIEQVGVADMLTGSRLVVHGEVVDRWTDTNTDESEIYTHVRVRVMDVIKGADPGETLELRFLGGTHGSMTLQISGQYVPHVGDEAVYFIENPARTQINPIFGWRQGHFPVRLDEFGRQKLVFTHDLQPVFALSPARASADTGFSRGVALGVATTPSADQSAMTLESFKQRLRGLEEELK